MEKIESKLQVKATAQLRESVNEDLNVPDPAPEVAKAALVKGEKDFPIKEIEAEVPENPRDKKESKEPAVK